MILYRWMRKILDQLFPFLVSRNSILVESNQQNNDINSILFSTFVFYYVIIHHNSHIDYVNGNATKIQNIYHWMRKILDQLFPFLVSRNSILETKSITLTLLYFLPLYFVIFLYFYFHQKINQKNEPLKIKKSF